MTWDITTPADDEKIRKLGTIGRAHWKAIQDADLDGAPFLLYRALQMADRTALGVAEDPTVAASTAYIYSKNDVALAAGSQELFIRDAASNIIQVTNDGKIGSTATNFEADSISFDGTRTFNENAMAAAWCYCLSNGTLQYGYNVDSVTKLAGDGHYQVNFTAGALPTVYYSLFVCGQNTNASWDGTALTVNAASFYTRTTNSGTPADANFFFVAFGGQV